MKTHSNSIAPHPKRYWWLKRLSLAALAIVVLLVGLRLVWGQRVQAKLDQAVAEIQSKDEPILFEDLVYEPLPDTENGAWYLTQALNSWPSIPGQPGVTIHDTDWYLEGEEYSEYDDPITDNAAYLASCRSVFDLLRQSDQAKRSAYGSGPTRPLFHMLLPQLGNNRSLARYVDDAAKRGLKVGDTELVFETMLIQHAIARHSLGEPTVLIDSLVAISIMAMSRDFIEHALPQIDTADLREGLARELAKEVIQRLTDGMTRESMIKGFIGERAAMYDLYECMIDGTATASGLVGFGTPIEWVIDTPGLSHAYRPALKNAQLLTTNFYTAAIESLRNETAHNGLDADTAKLEQEAYDHPVLYPMAGMLLPANGAAMRTLDRSEALLHCAAIAIAIKLYEADHGKRPDTLDQLVPDYLPAIPKDPFSKTGEPIGYNPGGVVPS
ncbi:MAG: hypothetical protein AB8C95_03330, partial [Phycisphaeraceae bacterium]